MGQVLFTNSGVQRMTTTKQYDFLNRLTSISSLNSQLSTLNSSTYSYNDSNQRTRRLDTDGSYWRYGYDFRGQVTSGNRYWADFTAVAGQQFQYTFDDIGNRTATGVGGDQYGANLRSARYYPNALNQYTSREVPGAVDIMGVAFTTNTVTVAGQSPYRKGEYFREELGVTNGSSALWTNISVSSPGQTAVSGHEFVPANPESFAYDADGNLIQDGHWNYGWDAENRLVSMTNRASAAPAQVLRFEYDPKGRRIRKWSSATGSGTPDTDLRFVYDGWNLVAILNSSFVLQNSFSWGLDLSGSLQGAGGVGGLLMETYNGAQTTNCCVAYDGNGNVSALVNAADGNTAAQYEYGPFGEVVRATGPMAKANPFRFSTKFQDDETELLQFGYRYYNESTGRWLSRDPLAETAFYTLRLARTVSITLRTRAAIAEYIFVGNNSSAFVDLLGLESLAIYNGCSSGDLDQSRKFGIFKRCYARGANGKDFERIANHFDRKIDICSLKDPKFKSLIEAVQELVDDGVDITSVAFIDHGGPGVQQFTDDDVLQDPAMPDYDYAAFGKLLSKDAKISFYGCNVGDGKNGKAYLQNMANYFGRPVDAQTGTLRCNRFYSGGCCRGGKIITADPK